HTDGKFFIWNLVSTLIPRQWHFDIGGFDEKMPTWEDWDYWLRMAKGGRCFTRIQKPFVIYNYISGNLREMGLQIANEVLQYLKEKHSKVKIMACGCGKRKRAGEIVATSEGYVEAWYLHRNVGNHDVTVGSHRYGRYPGGRRVHFPVLAEHVRDNPKLFEEYAQIVSDPEPQPEAMPEPVSIAPPPPPIDEALRPIDLSGLKPTIQKILREANLTTVDMIDMTGYDNLLLLDGIGPATAKKIMELAE
ncbi:hypothetical protein LCGC14_2696340, partial [marine sediment metagenome]